ncbi:hypothetical protein BC940DRAFT_337404 [Gongronella butleri]|nr:hypothetical protein BC940DRAFT_337404 [Gongronella butleri]
MCTCGWRKIQAAFGLFSPLFDFILLSPPGRTQIHAHSLLFRWLWLLYSSSLTPSILSAYLASVCKRYPWHYAMEGYIALVDMLLDVERHAGPNEHAASARVLAAGQSALLMVASTMHDQIDTLKLLRACIDRTDASLSRLYWVALLLLFQMLTECQQGPAAIRNDNPRPQ